MSNLDSGRCCSAGQSLHWHFCVHSLWTVTEHTGFCTSAWWERSGNLNISGIYGAGSRYGGAGWLFWIPTQPVAAVVGAARRHPFAYVCVHSPSVCALCPFSNATKGQKAIHQSGASPHPEHFPYTHWHRCPSQTTLKPNSSGRIFKSLVFLNSGRAPVRVQCTSCAVRRPPVECCGLPAPQLGSDRLQIEINVLCFFLCRNQRRASLCRWWNHYFLLKSCKLNPLLQKSADAIGGKNLVE